MAIDSTGEGGGGGWEKKGEGITLLYHSDYGVVVSCLSGLGNEYIYVIQRPKDILNGEKNEKKGKGGERV